MIPPVKSLVRYDKEVFVSTSKKGASGKDKLAKSGLKKSLPPVDPKASAQSQTEDILNSILPPRYDAVLLRSLQLNTSLSVQRMEQRRAVVGAVRLIYSCHSS